METFTLYRLPEGMFDRLERNLLEDMAERTEEGLTNPAEAGKLDDSQQPEQSSKHRGGAMLQRGSVEKSVHEHGFLISIELEEGGPTPEQVQLKLADACMYVEGVGKTDVSYMGQLDVVEVKGED